MSKVKIRPHFAPFIMGLMQRQFNSAISAGMAGYQASSALTNAPRGSTMGHITQNGPNMYTYSLKHRYNIGDISGARGYYYVWDSNENYSG
jgi:hypothetical protein